MSASATATLKTLLAVAIATVSLSACSGDISDSDYCASDRGKTAAACKNTKR